VGLLTGRHEVSGLTPVRRLDAKAGEIIEDMMEDGTLRQNTKRVHGLVFQLRQSTHHPCLLDNVIAATLGEQDFQVLLERCPTPISTYLHKLSKLQKRYVAEATGKDQLGQLSEQELMDINICLLCLQNLEDPQITIVSIKDL
jgi:hypothetical protein